MEKGAPQKTCIPAPEEGKCGCNECEYMNLITREKVYNCLKYEFPTIEVDEEIAKKAVRPINRMLEISKQMGL